MIPSLRLIEHEWDRHGGCTGLTPETYFTQMRKIAAGVYLPLSFRVNATPPATTTAAALRAEFLRVNRSLTPDAIAIVCRKQALQEVRLCFTKAGAPRACGPGVKDKCPMGKISVPAMSAS
jgi:ribonuclease T2